MYPLKKDIIFSIIQFLKEAKYEETLHKLEQESRIFFNWDYFGEIVINGEWEKADKYLSAFTKLDDNRYSSKMFFSMRRQKYIEALDRNDQEEAWNILWNDLEVFSYSEIVELFGLKNFRKNRELAHYLDTASARACLRDELKTLVHSNPILQDKLMFPNMKKSRLLSIILDLIRHNPEQQTRYIKASVFDTMASLKRELIFIILQFLDEKKFKGTLHELEQESKIFFNMNYFEQCVINGEWDKAKKYLSAFTKLDNNRNSAEKSFEMQVKKYIEGLHIGRNVHDKALNSVWKDLKVLEAFSYYIFEELAELFLSKNFRQNKFLSTYIDTASSRTSLCDALKTLVKGDPILQDKFMFPSMDTAGFLALIKKKFFRQTFLEMKSAIWKLTQVKEPSECRTLVLPDKSLAGRVARLIYSHSGDLILAIAHDAAHKIWKWPSDQHWTEKANAIVKPQLYQLSSGIRTTDEKSAHPENSVPFFALTKNDAFLFSASGGEISLFILETFKTLATSMMSPPSAATYLAVLPQDNNIIAIGFEDSLIEIHCPYTNEVKARLEGHQKRITCLAFSEKLNVLVSSGADAQLCVWSTDGWEKQANIFVQTPTQQVLDPPVVNHIEFHKDQIRLLVVHERQIDIYAAPKLEQLYQLVLKSSYPITHATYSCDGQSIYVSFKNGCVGVYVDKTLKLRCAINLTAYTQPDPSMEVYPLVIAAHPSEPNQFALGLTNGRVHVLEPLESEGEWGIPPPPEEGDWRGA